MIALLMAGGISLAVALVGTRYLIEWLRAHQVGQSIREEGPQGHQTKAGTPIMGGIAIVAAAAVGYGVAHLRSRVVFTRSGIFVLLLIIGAGFVGFLDDWIGFRRERNLGLNKRMKVLGMLFVVSSLIAAPRLGAAPTIAAVICGQLVSALLLDHFGVLHARRPVDLGAIAGLAMLVAGAALILRK